MSDKQSAWDWLEEELNAELNYLNQCVRTADVRAKCIGVAGSLSLVKRARAMQVEEIEAMRKPPHVWESGKRKRASFNEGLGEILTIIRPKDTESEVTDVR